MDEKWKPFVHVMCVCPILAVFSALTFNKPIVGLRVRLLGCHPCLVFLEVQDDCSLNMS